MTFLVLIGLLTRVVSIYYYLITTTFKLIKNLRTKFNSTFCPFGPNYTYKTKRLYALRKREVSM